MRLKLLSFVLASGLAFASCKKDETTDQIGNKDINEISAPANFNWSGSRDVSLSIGITDGNFGNQIHVIKIYSADPAKGGELISSGSATQILPFNTKFALSSMIKEVFVVKVAPSGASVQQTLALTSDNVSANISATGVNAIASVGRVSANRAISAVTVETNPTVPAGATQLTSSNNWSNPNGNQNYVIKSNSSVSLNAPNGDNTVLYIDGTGITIGALNIQKNMKVIITAGSSVTMSGVNWDNTGSFSNFGTIAYTGSFQPRNGTVRNQGTFTISGDFTTNHNSSTTIVVNTGEMTIGSGSNLRGQIDNSGKITAKGQINFDNSSRYTNEAGSTLKVEGTGYTNIEGVFTNAGTFNGDNLNLKNNTQINNSGTFTGLSVDLGSTFTNSGTVTMVDLTINSQGSIVNNCKWYVTTTSVMSVFGGPVENNSYFSVAGRLALNSNGKVTLKNGAFFTVKDIDGQSEKIVASGSPSVFKFTTGYVHIANHNYAVKFSGPMQVIYPNITLPSVMFEGSAAQQTSSNAAYIPTSTCMPEGSGTAPVNNDRDGDGVINSEDAYPDDATKAFISYSENYLAGGSTIAFEDSWPLKGDYDLNDVVINYKYKVITNAQNKVVRVEADYKLLATGGEFQNGAGIEFPIAAAKATGFSGPTGTSLESGQEKAVVILFQNSRAEQATWNTQTGQTTSPAKDYAIAFNVVDGPNISDFGISTFNPFIWNGSAGFGRGYETHLYGKKPTSKANTSLFGTGNDATNQTTRYYGTSNNLPWAITLPIATFKYPLERVPITDGYLQFSNWATNGGSQSQDWFSNTSPAYRNASKLYGSN